MSAPQGLPAPPGASGPLGSTSIARERKRLPAPQLRVHGDQPEKGDSTQSTGRGGSGAGRACALAAASAPVGSFSKLKCSHSEASRRWRRVVELLDETVGLAAQHDPSKSSSFSIESTHESRFDRERNVRDPK